MKAPARRPRRLEPLDISAAEGGFVVYDPAKERVHYLNHSALLVLELCNGSHTADEIAAIVAQGYALGRPPHREVKAMLARFSDEGLIRG